jgi:uncharacterized lipoprotein YajG
VPINYTPARDTARLDADTQNIMKQISSILGALFLLAGCASSSPIATGKDTYMLTKTSAGGVFVSGTSVKADLLKEANEFCAKQGKTMTLLNGTAKNAIPFARMPSSEISFQCVEDKT